MVDVRVHLKIDQLVAMIFSGKSFWVAAILIMLLQTQFQIIGHTGAQNGLARVGRDVDIIIAFGDHNETLYDVMLEASFFAQALCSILKRIPPE